MDDYNHVNVHLNFKKSKEMNSFFLFVLPFKRDCGCPTKLDVGRCGCKCEKLAVTCGCCLVCCSGGATQTPSE